ncbi:hypothetical protein KSP40_PGU022286 [Platanthera guangdongensis]|uniref:Uncharacterized protein n=1 Tax=Platanthera guangdongensis TaxID=2320717 RepID=A0ABR2M9J3_9ASPA
MTSPVFPVDEDQAKRSSSLPRTGAHLRQSYLLKFFNPNCFSTTMLWCPPRLLVSWKNTVRSALLGSTRDRWPKVIERAMELGHTGLSVNLVQMGPMAWIERVQRSEILGFSEPRSLHTVLDAIISAIFYITDVEQPPALPQQYSCKFHQNTDLGKGADICLHRSSSHFRQLRSSASTCQVRRKTVSLLQHISRGILPTPL